MRMRNGDHGYGVVTKTLHWATVAAVAGQFAVGYTMEAEGRAPDVDCDPPGEDRSGGDTSDAERERLEDRCQQQQDGREEAAEDGVGTAFSDLGSGDLFTDGLSLPEAHVLLGLLIIGLGLVRVLWRSTTPLPPWSGRLGAADRKLESLLEKVLLTLLFVVPGTGLLLVLGEDDLLPVHIAAHLLFFVTLALHVGLVLRRRLLPRML